LHVLIEGADTLPLVGEGSYCQACGQPAAGPGHEGCARLLAFDPPRYCAICAFRLDVQVFPDGYRSRCRRCACGIIPSPKTR
jgi:hypothetical protein